MAGTRNYVKWFWHEDKTLEDMFERECTDAEIALTLGRTVGSIADRRYERGLFRIRRGSRHHKAQKADAIENGSFFSMVSPEETLPDGTRRRLYGDLTLLRQGFAGPALDEVLLRATRFEGRVLRSSKGAK